MNALIQVNRGQRSIPFTLPAPIGGLNGRDGLAEMPPNDAFVLDNWFPNNTTLDTRGGTTEYTTGLPGPVESIEVYMGGAVQKMLAFSQGQVFDISAPGVAGTPIKTGRTSNKITSAMFSNAGSQFLIGLSGTDPPFSYDGVAFVDLAITGLTGSQNTLHGVLAFKGRLYFAQKDQLGFYYLGIGAIQGAASYFDLAQVAMKGGYLAGIGSFSSDSGNGPADYIVFMTNFGEYIVYSGTDPSNAATWALVGRYYSSPPIGRKGWFNFRSDLYIVGDEGVIAFSQIRSDGESGTDILYLSAKLGKYLNDLVQYNLNHGWCAVTYPRQNMLIINVPLTGSENGDYCQFVMNTDTNAWCRFTGWNALSWARYNKQIYFGTYSGKVMWAYNGFNDDGTDIKCDCRQAYNYFDDGKGMGSADKHFHFATFIMQSEGTPPISAELDINFEDDAPDYYANLAANQGAQWDLATWDVDSWSSEGHTQNVTIQFAKIGYTASVWLRAQLQDAPLKWYATRIICERAKGLVLL